MPCNETEAIAVTNWIIECIEDKKNIWGPFEDQKELKKALGCQKDAAIAPMGAVPKKVAVDGKVLSHRVITHLSAPRKGTSVNSCINEKDKDVSYIKLREIVRWVKGLGIGAWIWSADAKDAYLRVPAHKKQWKYLCFKWYGMYFVICSLPFGLASACKIYTAFADAVQWIIIDKSGGLFEENGDINIFHYLDDFFGGSIDKKKAARQLHHAMDVFDELGIPTTKEKCCAPSTVPKILGFEYDTNAQCIRIPEKKVERYMNELKYILKLKSIKKRDLLKIIGKLRWASTAIFPGAAFVRHLENAAYRCKQMYWSINLNKELKRELKWWLDVLPSARNGIPFDFILKSTDDFDIEIYTDASTSFGVGGHQKGDVKKWFRYEWRPRVGPKPDICFEELLGVCTAVELWGHTWKGKSVKFYCDNIGVVEMLKRKCCVFKREDMMELIRIIGSAAARYGFYFKIYHIKGVDNKIADGLSRKEGIDKEFENEIVGDGDDCDQLIESLLGHWNKNVPDVEIVKKCGNGLSYGGMKYCVDGWSNYKKLRNQSRAGWSLKHNIY